MNRDRYFNRQRFSSGYQMPDFSSILEEFKSLTEKEDLMHDQYANAKAQAFLIGNKISKTDDPDTYITYNNYLKQLEKAADHFSKTGLNYDNKQTLREITALYNQDIKSIENSITKRDEIRAKQIELARLDPTIRFQIDFRTKGAHSSLDRFKENPDYGYGNEFSGKAIREEVSNTISKMAAAMDNAPEEFSSIMNGQYWLLKTRQGYSTAQILAAAANDPNAPQELKNVVKKAVENTGVHTWGSQADIDAAYGYGNEGLWSGAGPVTYTNVANKDHMSPLDNLNYQLAKDKLELSKLELALKKQSLLSKLNPTSNNTPRVSFPKISMGVEHLNKEKQEEIVPSQNPLGWTTQSFNKALQDISSEIDSRIVAHPSDEDHIRSQYSGALGDLNRMINNSPELQQKDAAQLKEYLFQKAGIQHSLIGREIPNEVRNADVIRNEDGTYTSSNDDYKNAPQPQLQALYLLNYLGSFLDDLTPSMLKSAQYSYLSDDNYDAVSMGSALEKAQNSVQTDAIVYTTDPTENKKVKIGISETLKAFDTDQIKNNDNIGLFDSKGRKRDTWHLFSIRDNHYDIAKKLVDSPIRITSGKTPKMEFVVDGEPHTIKGIDAIDNFNNGMLYLNDFMTNYKGLQADDMIEFTPEQVEAYNNGTLNITEDQLSKIKFIDGTNGLFKGLIVKIPGKTEDNINNVLKLVLDTNNKIVGGSSFYDELYGGVSKSDALENIINKYLTTLFRTYSAKDKILSAALEEDSED